MGTDPDWGWHSGIEGWEGQSHGDRKQDSPTSTQRSNENRHSQHPSSHENPKRCLNLSWFDSQVIVVISLSASNSCICGQATSFLIIFAHKTQVSLWTRSLSILLRNNSCAICQLDWSLLSLVNFKIKKLERIYESAPLRHGLSHLWLKNVIYISSLRHNAMIPFIIKTLVINTWPI